MTHWERVHRLDLVLVWVLIRLLDVDPAEEPGNLDVHNSIFERARALATLARGYQVAFLAPTELLAEQHLASVQPWLAGSAVRAVLVTASRGAAERRAAQRELASGSAHLVFGTHALLSGSTVFGNLGLCIIDEHHRFGVAQRMRLLAKGRDPHVLVMTATPIPRTLTLALFGDLESVLMRERPLGRPVARAFHMGRNDWQRVLAITRRRVARRQRVFFVSPKIGEDGSEGGATALAAALGRHFEVGLVHGRMNAADRQQVTAAFRRGEFQILVGTTVLEVGVDVPEATLMVVVGCDRFGLATLHQLRGRVGRGRRRGLCLLVGASGARTEALCRTTDGFALAEEDLAIRGSGELLGMRQSGAGDLRALDPVADLNLLLEARAAVREEP